MSPMQVWYIVITFLQAGVKDSIFLYIHSVYSLVEDTFSQPLSSSTVQFKAKAFRLANKDKNTKNFFIYKKNKGKMNDFL